MAVKFTLLKRKTHQAKSPRAVKDQYILNVLKIKIFSEDMAHLKSLYRTKQRRAKKTSNKRNGDIGLSSNSKRAEQKWKGDGMINRHVLRT